MNSQKRNWKRRLGASICCLAALGLLIVGSARAERVTEGALYAYDAEMRSLGACPLEHTDVDVAISGFIARVTVTQQFGNPFESPIEAVYTFPLSERGAVDSMSMTVGDRVISGLIKRREEARRIYETARAAGQIAGLLDQERPNIFTQYVANILPGEKIDITISYVEYLKYEDGEYEFSFPMVVGPRYIPGAPSCGVDPGTGQVPDAGRITPPVTPEGTRAGHDISVAVTLEAGVPVRDIRSELHEIDVIRRGASRASIELRQQRDIPNRDFVLRYAVAGERIKDAVLTHAGAQGGFFSLILQPPDRVAPEQVMPKEMIFIIDRSGSMSGFPIEKAKRAMRLCVEQMNPNDTFNLISFAGGLGYCFKQPVLNTPENRRKALAYLDGLRGGGGTEMMSAIRAALAGQNDPGRLRIVCFMTDGFIGNDMAILDAIQQHANAARVFSFGIGNGVNRFLIEGMARAGRGAAEVVTLESEGDEAAKRFHERIHSPILTDITIDFGGLDVTDVLPNPAGIPDLFASRPLILTGRYETPGEGYVTVRGRTVSGPFERKIRVRLPEIAEAHDVLAPLWARQRIAALMAKDWMGAQRGRPETGIKKAVTQLGLDYGLVTQYTSFVAVEKRVVNKDGRLQTVEVPVEMTDGVSYEGVFGDSLSAGRRVAVSQSMALGKRVQKLGAPAAPKPKPAYRLRSMRNTADLSAAETREWASRPVAVVEEAPAIASRDERVDRSRSNETLGRTAGSRALDKLELDGDGNDAPSRGSDDAVSAKLAPALRGLRAKLVGGNYSEGALKVINGWVEVFVRLEDDSQANLDALKALGVRIVSHARSGKTLLARVRVEDLEKVAGLAFVRFVEPPAY